MNEVESKESDLLTEMEALKARLAAVEADLDQHKAALLEINTRYLAIFEQTNDAVFILDLDGNHVAVNQKAADMLGYTIAELSQLSYREATAESQHQEAQHNLALMKAGSALPLHERILRHKDGHEIPTEINTSLVRDLDGKPLYIQSVVRDISDRKRMELELFWQLAVNLSLSMLSVPLLTESTSIEEIADLVLEQSKVLTDSEHGFVSVIDPATGDNIAYTLTEMLRGECKVAGEARCITFPRGGDGRYHALWGHSLNTGEAFFTNSPGTHPASIGTPDGHVPLKRFLSVPVKLSNQVVGQIALSNSSRDYTGRDLDAINKLAELYALGIQRMRSEEALRKSETEYRLLFEEMASGFALHEIICDDQGKPCDYRFLRVNPAFEQLTGLRAGELIGKRVLEVLPNTEPYWIEEYGRVALTGQPIRFESHSAELGKYYEVRAFCPEPGQFAVLFHDITDRKRYEEALRESEEKYRLLFATETDTITVFDVETLRFLDVNESAVKMYGYSREEFLEMVVTDVSAEPEETSAAVHTASSGGPSNVPLRWHRRKNGEIFPVEISSGVFTWKGRQVMSVIIRDIGERLQAEAALRESEARMAEAQRLAHIGSWDWDMKTGELVWSDEIYRIFDLPPDQQEVTGRTLLRYIHPSDRDYVRNLVKVALSEYQDFSVDCRIVLPGGTERVIHEKAEFTFDGSGEPVRMSGTIQDVTGRKQAEQQALELALERERVRSLTNFIKDAAHDFRTPLSTINTSIYLLRKTQDPQRIARHISTLESQATHLERLVDCLFTLARLDGSIGLDFRQVSVWEIAHDLRGKINALAQKKNREVDLIVDGNLTSIRADGVELHRALMSIVENALCYSTDGSVTVTFDQQGETLTIAVSDQGIGIGEADLPYIFDRFFRADKARSTETGGLGLGLSIAGKIVELHGGHIEVESALGKGSTFRVVLPVEGRPQA